MRANGSHEELNSGAATSLGIENLASPARRRRRSHSVRDDLQPPEPVGSLRTAGRDVELPPVDRRDARLQGLLLHSPGEEGRQAGAEAADQGLQGV
eukprot:3946445-Prymnesium_polylepis.1